MIRIILSQQLGTGRSIKMCFEIVRFHIIIIVNTLKIILKLSYVIRFFKSPSCIVF